MVDKAIEMRVMLINTPPSKKFGVSKIFYFFFFKKWILVFSKYVLKGQSKIKHQRRYFLKNDSDQSHTSLKRREGE